MHPFRHPGRATSGLDPWLLGILVVALAFRLVWLELPIAEAHSFRQLFNADVARGFAERTANIFHPQVSWAGQQGVVGMEFPLLQYILGLLFRVVGQHDVLARLITIPTSLGLVIAVYQLGAEWFGMGEARGAAFLMAVSPSVVFFGRAFLADEAMVMCSVFALAAYTRYLGDGHARSAFAGAAWLALGGLLKLPAVIVGAPIAWLALHRLGRRRVSRDRVLSVSSVAALVTIAAWYIHAHYLYTVTGLSVAIFAPAGQYPPPLNDVLLPTPAVTSWASIELLSDPSFYEGQVMRATWVHLTPLGVLGAVYGVLASRGRRYRSALDVWLLAGLLFIIVAARGHRPHEYYQLPLLPIAALYFGLGAAPLFSSQRLAARSIGPYGRVWLFTALCAIAVAGFKDSQVIHNLYRIGRLDVRTLEFGRLIAEHTEPDALVITTDGTGNQSPLLLYRAHRQGWSLDFETITPTAVEMLRDSYGVDFVAVSIWPALNEKRPEMVHALERYCTIPLDTNDDWLRLFDLRCATGGAQ